MDDTVLNKKLVLAAVKTLKCVRQVHQEDSQKKKPLLDDEASSTLFLQVQLKKVLKTNNIKRIKVSLPHSLVNENTEVCLITGDLDKNDHKADIEPDILHYKELLKEHGITNVSEVITLRQLRTEYKPYEAKLKLLAAYDVFLADNKIAECLPTLLGKHFFKKRKFPISINMKTGNLKSQIDNALTSNIFHVTGRGNSCNFEVANLDMSDEEIFENIDVTVKTLSQHLPGSLANIMGIYVKTDKSKSMPVYISYWSPNDLVLSEEVEEDEFELDELTTVPHACVKVFKDGTVKAVSSSALKISQGLAAEGTESDMLKTSSSKNGLASGYELDDNLPEADADSKKVIKKLTGKEILSASDEDAVVEISPKRIKKDKKAKKGLKVKELETDFEMNDEPSKTDEKSKKATKKDTGKILSTNSGIVEEDDDAVILPKRSIKDKKTKKGLKVKELQTDFELEEEPSETVEKPKKGKKKSTGKKILSANGGSVDDDDAVISPKGILKDKETEEALKAFLADCESEEEPTKTVEKPKKALRKSTGKKMFSTNGGSVDDDDAVISPKGILKDEETKEALKAFLADFDSEDEPSKTVEKPKKARKKSTGKKIPSTNGGSVDDDAVISHKGILKDEETKMDLTVEELQTELPEESPISNKKLKKAMKKIIAEACLAGNSNALAVDSSKKLRRQAMIRASMKIQELPKDLGEESRKKSTNKRKRSVSTSGELESVQEAVQTDKRMKLDKVITTKSTSMKQIIKSQKKKEKRFGRAK